VNGTPDLLEGIVVFGLKRAGRVFLIFGIFIAGVVPFCDLGFLDWEEWVWPYREVLQFTLLHEPEKLPGKVGQSVDGKIHYLQCCQSANCRRDLGQLVVPQTENLEVAELE
jgi:hypothetical protein